MPCLRISCQNARRFFEAASAARVMLPPQRPSMGIAYSPTWLFEAELASGEVQRLLPDWETLPMPIHLVSPQQRRHSAKVQAFAAFVAESMAGT